MKAVGLSAAVVTDAGNRAARVDPKSLLYTRSRARSISRGEDGRDFLAPPRRHTNEHIEYNNDA